MSELVTCDLTGKTEYFWKCARVSDGILCPQAYFDVIEATGIPGSIEEYKKHVEKLKTHNNYMNHYVTTLRRYEQEFDQIVLLESLKVVENNISERLFKKERRFLTITEELLLTGSVLAALTELSGKSPQELKKTSVKGHPDNNRYYTFIERT